MPPSASGKKAVDSPGKLTDTEGMTGTEQLLAVARAYAAAEGVELKTASWRALGDGKKLDAIECGADIQVGRFERAMRWFSDNWPRLARWPDGVVRPEVSLREPDEVRA